MKRALLVLSVLAVLACGITFAVIDAALDAPTRKAGTLLVRPGATLRSVLGDLHERDIVASPHFVYRYAQLVGRTNIRAGEYDIGSEQSARDILAMLEKGRVKTATFTLAEGLNRWQVRDTLATEGWIDETTFDRLCDDADFLKKHQIPGPSCDGYFYPETYTFARGVAAQKIFAAVFAEYRRQLAEATAQGTGPLSLSERELTTLASIVEKETGAAVERPRIACVFYNRLQAKPVWRLQTDPTVIYAAILSDPTFDGNIKRRHLREMKNPYNTYTNYGLPPGPIASPGRAAFDAVIKPATCGDFFFVSKNNGTHEFCPTLACHEAAVQKWQIEYFRKKR